MNKRQQDRIDKAIAELDVHETGSSDETVSQHRLRQYETIENEFRALRKKHQELRVAMNDVMRQGASTAPGRLGLKTGIRLVRRPSYLNEVKRLAAKLGIDPEKHHQQVLNATVPSAHFYVRLLHSKNGSKREE